MNGETPISIRNLSVYYGDLQVLKDVNLDIPARKITVIIGPSGCGKTTLLKSLNRLLDTAEGVACPGRGRPRRREHLRPPDRGHPDPEEDGPAVAEAPGPAHVDLRQRRLRPAHPRPPVEERPRPTGRALPPGGRPVGRGEGPAARAGLGRSRSDSSSGSAWPGAWPSSRRSSSATSRPRPSIPSRARTSSAGCIELKRDYTVVVVTHILRQARRIADYLAFLYLGELVEHGPAAEIFAHPRDPRTRAYLTGEIS